MNGLNAVSFNCTACGKCCNSAPLMSLPELLHHEDLFVGCLGLRQIPTLKAGEEIRAGDIRHLLDADDAQGMSDLAATLHFKAMTRNARPCHISIATQALDYVSLKKCPALLDDHRCSIHNNRKPSTCSMVPFDSLYPDRLQSVVLLGRKLEENCIVAGRREGYETVVEGGRIISPEYMAAVTQRREDLAQDKELFGDTVFELLRRELFSHAPPVQTIPVEGVLTLSLAPVLMIVAQGSDKCRSRCLRYLDRQIILMDAKIQEALRRKTAEDKPVTRELRGFIEAYRRLRPVLAEADLGISQRAETAERKTRIEAYLGLAENATAGTG